MSYVVVARVKVKEGARSAFLEKLKVHVELSRLEKGCKQFDVSVDNEDDREFLFIEQYVDEAAFLEHKSLDRVKHHLASVATLVEEGAWAKKLTKLTF